MALTITIDGEMEEQVRRQAARRGLEPADFVRSLLGGYAGAAPKAGEAERATANARLWQHVVSLGHPTGTDNEAIDADLAGAYANSHESGN